MQRSVSALLLAGLVAAGCGELKDDGKYCTKAQLDRADPTCGRPLDADYITATILAPACGQTQCHSTFHQAGGLVFDTFVGAKQSLLVRASGPLLQFTSESFDPKPDGYKPVLLQWLTDIDPTGKGTGRMPFDAPLPDHDIDLISVWIRAASDAVDSDGVPLKPGGSAVGAQCDPDLYRGLACNRDDLVQCATDYNFGEPMMTCAKGCAIADVCDVPRDPTNKCKCPAPTRVVAGCAPLEPPCTPVNP